MPLLDYQSEQNSSQLQAYQAQGKESYEIIIEIVKSNKELFQNEIVKANKNIGFD